MPVHVGCTNDVKESKSQKCCGRDKGESTQRATQELEKKELLLQQQRKLLEVRNEIEKSDAERQGLGRRGVRLRRCTSKRTARSKSTRLICRHQSTSEDQWSILGR